jgi:hypothetical protein
VWLHLARTQLHSDALNVGRRRELLAAGLTASPSVQAFIDTIDHLAAHRDRCGRTAPLPNRGHISDDGFPLGDGVDWLLCAQPFGDEQRAYLIRRLGYHYLNEHRLLARGPVGLTMPNLFGHIIDEHGPAEVFRRAYTRYVHLHGAPDVPYDHVCADGLPLGSWFEVLASTPQRATLPGQERSFVERVSPHVAWAVRSTAQARTTARMLVRLELRAETGTDLRLLAAGDPDSPEARWLRDEFPRARVTRDEARRFASLDLRNTHTRRLHTVLRPTGEVA